MAHGAPDHVRMGDVNLLDYTDHYFRDGAYDIPNDTLWEFVTVDGVGCLGLTYFRSEWGNTFLRIDIDGVMVFYENINRIWLHHATIGQTLSNHCGVTQYDVVNNQFGFWADFHYKMSFKTSLRVALYNQLGVNCQITNINCYWKERG